MAQEDFYMRQGDTFPELQVTLKDSANAAVDVTGSTIKFSMVERATGLQKVNEGAVTLVTAASGIVKYPWAASDTDEWGEYQGEFEVTYSGGGIETFPNNRGNQLAIHIERQLG